jgi:hypothetical protein
LARLPSGDEVDAVKARAGLIADDRGVIDVIDVVDLSGKTVVGVPGNPVCGGLRVIAAVVLGLVTAVVFGPIATVIVGPVATVVVGSVATVIVRSVIGGWAVEDHE